jgi:F-type H+-transporting ATPase subunit gamma
VAQAKLIKNRIKAAKNISQITKAMQMVSAAKMKKAQDQASQNRIYSKKLFEMARNLVKKNEADDENKKTLFVVITPSKGLCGSLNTNLTRKLIEETKDIKEKAVFITIGKKGEQAVTRLGGNLLASFDFGFSQPRYESVVPVAKMILDEFNKGNLNKIIVLYANFVNTLVQFPDSKQILPVKIEEEELKTDKNEVEYVFEPSREQILKHIVPYYIENQLFQLVLEAYASEQSARMIAMKNATDNASEVVKELTLVYNRARQMQITNEINDNATAQMAI